MLFDIEQYRQPNRHSYECDWDSTVHDPAWDELDDFPEISQNIEPLENSNEKVSTVMEVLDKDGEEIPLKIDQTSNVSEIFLPHLAKCDRSCSGNTLVAPGADNWFSPVLKTQPVCFCKMQDAVLPVNQTSSTRSHKQPLSVLPVNQTSSTRSHKQPPSVLPVNQTSSTRSDKQPLSVLPVDQTSSTRSHKQLPSVLPVDQTSSTQFRKQSLSVLPVDQTSSTQFRKQPLSVLPVNQTSSTQFRKQPPSVLPVEQTSSTTRRSRGEGTGRIHWRTITKKNGKQYQQAWYDWQHSKGKTISKSTYIPKRLLSQVQQLEAQKAPIRKILKVLGITQ